MHPQGSLVINGESTHLNITSLIQAFATSSQRGGITESSVWLRDGMWHVACTSVCVHASCVFIISISTVPFLYLDLPIYDIHSMQYDPLAHSLNPQRHVKHCQTLPVILTQSFLSDLHPVVQLTQQLVTSWTHLSVGGVA